MAFVIKPSEREFIRDAWLKLMRMAGYPYPFDFNVADLAVDHTTEALTLWVDPSGSDSAMGTQSAPLLTISEALSRVPRYVGHDVTIKVNAGTYPESLLVNVNLLNASSLTIEGQSWVVVTPTSGLATGTVASVSLQTLSVSGAAWDINDFKGRFLHVLTGGLAGRYLPIASNTSNTIDLHGNEALTGATFEIVKHGVLVTGSGTSDLPRTVRGSARFTTVSTTAGFVILKALEISGPSTTISVEGNWKLDSVKVISPATCVSAVGAGEFLVVDSHIKNQAATVGFGFSISSAVTAQINSTVITGDNTQNSFLGFIMSGRLLGCNKLLIQDYPNTGNVNNNCVSSQGCNLQNLTIRNCNSALALGAGENFINDLRISALTGGDGVRIGTINDSGYSTKINGGSITGCRDGISYQGSHSSVVLLNTTALDISGNSRWGINMAPGLQSGFGNLSVNSSVTMGTNSSGDITLDGTTATAIADLRVDADKTIVDLVLLNRAVAQ
jgi:hypothetical protein